MIHELEGKCAVVTGGGGLIGRALARTFASSGMNVVVADVNVDAAKGIADEVRALGQRSLAVETDVTKLDSVAELAEQAYGAFGAVNLLCNNAGINVMRAVEELTDEDWHRVLAVNLEGVINGILSFLPRMIEQDDDRHIVNTASMSGVGLGELRPRHAPYVASKFAVVGLSEVLAPALERYNIGVSVLCPGLVVEDPRPTLKAPSAEWYREEIVSPEQVALEVVKAVKENRVHIFTQAVSIGEVLGRHALLMKDFELGGFGEHLA